MLVEEIMTRAVVSVDADASVLDACMLYKVKKVGCLVVVSGEACVGIVTERDLIERTLCQRRDPERTTVRMIMSSGVKTVHALETTERALQVMAEFHIKKLPVVKDGRIVGIVTVTDIAEARSDLSRRFIESWVKPQWRD